MRCAQPRTSDEMVSEHMRLDALAVYDALTKVWRARQAGPPDGEEGGEDGEDGEVAAADDWAEDDTGAAVIAAVTGTLARAFALCRGCGRGNDGSDVDAPKTAPVPKRGFCDLSEDPDAANASAA